MGTPPDVFWFHSAVAYMGRLYILFGYDELGQASAGVWSYDPTANAWAAYLAPQAAAAMARDGDTPVPRGGCAVTARLSGTFAVVGGSDVSGSRLPDFWLLNLGLAPGPGSWARGPDVPVAVAGGAAVDCGGDLIVLLGDTPSGPNLEILRYNWQGAWWTREPMFVPPAPAPTVAPAALPMTFPYQGGSIIMGGDWLLDPVPQNLSYDCATGIITIRDPMSDPAAGMSGALYGATLPTPVPGPPSGGDPSMEVRGLMFGGYRPGGFTNDTYYYAGKGPLGVPISTWLAVAAQIRARTDYGSRVEAGNVGQSTIGFDVIYTPRQDLGGPPVTVSRTLGPGVMETVDNVFADWFNFSLGTPAVGSLRFDVKSGNESDLKVQSVISALNDDGSSYGQFLKGVRGSQALLAGQTAYFATTENAQRNRANLGIVGLEDDSSFLVRPVGPIGTGLAPAEQFDLDRGESVQLNDLYARWNLPTQLIALVELSVARGRALGYVSALDGKGSYVGTNDPSTIWWYPDGTFRATLIELGPVQGLDEYSGSAMLTNLAQTASVTVNLDYYERGSTSPPLRRTVTIDPGGTVGWDDVVGDVFGRTNTVVTVVLEEAGGGSQSVFAGAGLATAGIAATGREYSIQRNGQGEIVGTAGQLMRGLTDADLLQSGTTYHILGLLQTGTTSGTERSHLAAFNPGSADITLSATLYDGDTAAAEGQKSWTVRGGELKQVNFVVGDIYAAQDGTSKRLEVTVSGPAFVAAFRVNKDGDPVTIEPLS